MLGRVSPSHNALYRFFRETLPKDLHEATRLHPLKASRDGTISLTLAGSSLVCVAASDAIPHLRLFLRSSMRTV